MSSFQVFFYYNLYNLKSKFTRNTDEEGFIQMPKIYDNGNRFSHIGWKQAAPTIYKPNSYLSINDFESKSFYAVWGYNMTFIYPKFHENTLNQEKQEKTWERDSQEENITITATKIHDSVLSIPKSSSIFLPPGYENLGWYAFNHTESKWIKINEDDQKLSKDHHVFPFWGVNPLNGTLRIRLNYHKTD